MAGSIPSSAKQANDILEHAVSQLSRVDGYVKFLHRVSYASVVAPGASSCKVYIHNTGQTVDAVLAHQTSFWNLTGYPTKDDVVLVFHRDDSSDVHVFAIVHPKTKSLAEYSSYENNDRITVGVLGP